MSNYEVLNKNLHANIRLKPVDGYKFASAQHLVSLVYNEFSLAALHYPVVFVRASHESNIHPMALLGLEAERNLFVDSAGNWKYGAYVPVAFRRYPFALTDVGGGETAICIMSQSSYFNYEEGELLIDAHGESTPSMNKIVSFLQEITVSELLATKFCMHLDSLGLFAPCEFKITGPDGTKIYNGSLMIDPNKFASLKEDEFSNLRKLGYLDLIYAHINSLRQIDKLSALASM